MQINVTTTHKVTFRVEYFEPTEGGMDSEDFGEPVETIEEAIALLEIARRHNGQHDWIITARAETKVNGKTVDGSKQPF